MASKIPRTSETPKMVDQSKSNNLVALFDDKNFMKEMRETQAPDVAGVDVQSLFALAKDTLDGATAVVENVLNVKGPSQAPSGNVVFAPPKQVVNAPLSAISRVSCQITCKALGTKNVRDTIEAIFHELSCYSWTVKSVITLSAFAIYYADFWRHADFWRQDQIQPSDKWAESFARLKGLPELITKPLDSPKNHVFITLNDMIRTTLKMTQCIVDFEHESKDVPQLSNSMDTVCSVYQIIISVLACSSQFTSLISLVDEHAGQDLLILSGNVKRIHRSIKQQFETFKQKKAEITEQKRLLSLLNAPTVNVELIKAFFPIMHGPQPAFFLGSKETTMDDMLMSLRRKNTLLLFSDLNLTTEDIEILVKIYKECKFQENMYEILWIPILEQEEAKELETQYRQLRVRMPWYSAHYKAVSRIAIGIIKEKWHFKQETTVVVLDPQGKVENQNAMHIIRIFESVAFPFTSLTAANLWNDNYNSWFKLLVADTTPEIQHAINEQKYIFLYDGGHSGAAIKEIEMCLKKIVEGGVTINYFDVSKSQLFRRRLESCIALMLQTGAGLFQYLKQDIFNLYNSYKESGGYVVLAKGSSVVTIGKLAIATKVWSEYDLWKEQVKTIGLDGAFKKRYDGEKAKKYGTQCLCFHLPYLVGSMPEDVKCPFCACSMRSVVKYECCCNVAN